jgi:hypothetical protein
VRSFGELLTVLFRGTHAATSHFGVRPKLPVLESVQGPADMYLRISSRASLTFRFVRNGMQTWRA